MTSRVSFWNSMKEDFKRRNWLLAIIMLLLFFIYPVRFAFEFDGVQNTWLQGYNSDRFTTLTENLQFVFLKGVRFEGMVTTFVTLIAFVSGIQGFSYLYKKQKVDLFYSVPVSKGKRFATVYFNGILIFAFAYLVNLLLGSIVALVSGGFTIQAFGVALASFAIYLVVFFTIYNITIVAVMMTGNLVVTFLATAVFLGYELLVKAVMLMLQSTFFVSHSYFSDNMEEGFLITPFYNLFEMLNNIFINRETWLAVGTDFGKNLIHLSIIGIITGLIAYYLHGKRPAEASERAIAFSKSKTPIKLLISIPISILSAGMFYSMTNENFGFLIFGVILGIILTHCIFEVIYEFDIRAVWNQKRQILFSGLITVVIFTIFYFDLTGYDNYVPKADKVESIALAWDNGTSDKNYFRTISKINSNNRWRYNQEHYQREYMKLTNLEEVLELAVIGMGNNKILERDHLPYSEQIAWITIKYNLTNGKEVYRNFGVGEESLELLKGIYSQPEYLEGTYQFLDNEMMDQVNQNQVTMIYLESNQQSRIRNGNVKDFLAVYQEEFMNYSYDKIVTTLPVGKVVIEEQVSEDGYSDSREWNMPIYEEFTKTLAYIEGCELVGQRNLMVSDVSNIRVVDHSRVFEDDNTDFINNTAGMEKEMVTLESSSSQPIEINEFVYTEERDIEIILPYLYPRDLIWNDNTRYQLLESDYEVLLNRVESNGERNQSYYDGYGYDMEFNFLKDQVPELVLEDLKNLKQ